MTKPSTGSIAPDFTLPALDGSPFSLSSLRGRTVLLSFLRNAQCALCNLWVHQTISRFETWQKKGLSVAAIFESTPDRLRLQFATLQPPFPVLADPDGAVHEMYGSTNDPKIIEDVTASGDGEIALKRAAAAGFKPVREEGSNFFRIPSEVIVGPKGRILLFHFADRIANHLAPEAVEKFIRAPAGEAAESATVA